MMDKNIKTNYDALFKIWQNLLYVSEKAMNLIMNLYDWIYESQWNIPSFYAPSSAGTAEHQSLVHVPLNGYNN